MARRHERGHVRQTVRIKAEQRRCRVLDRGREEHAEIARGIIAYVEWKLRDPERGYFYGSQDADEEFYKLDDNGYNAERGKTLGVPAGLEAAARLGAGKCPERAITIVEE